MDGGEHAFGGGSRKACELENRSTENSNYLAKVPAFS